MRGHQERASVRIPVLWRRVASWALLCCGVWLLSGCVTAGEGKRLRADITKLEAELTQMRTNSESDRAMLNDTLTKAQRDVTQLKEVLEEARSILGRNSADLSADLEELRRAVDTLRGSLDLTKRNLDQLQKAYDLFQKDVDTRLNSRSQLPSDPDELLAVANQKLNDKDFKLAREAADAFVESFPQDKRVSSALILVGQSYLKEERFQDAARIFSGVLRDHKDSKALDEANFGFGEALVGLGRCEDARVFYEEVVRKFRRSPLRQDARTRLQLMRRGKLCQ